MAVVVMGVGDVLEVQTEFLLKTVKYFRDRDFRWLLPRVLSPETDPLWPESDGVMRKTLTVVPYSQPLKLMKSMILHKQYAIGKGVNRFFILSPNIRVETESDYWHAFEFHQLDFEVAHARVESVMHFIEDYIRYIVRSLKREGLIDSSAVSLLKPPFRTYRLGEVSSLSELMDTEEKAFFITSIPREFYDFEDPNTGIWYNFDLVVPGYGEISSGAEREWEYEKIVRKIERDGLDPRDYSKYLELAKAGILKPSAGAGIGVDRLLTIILGEKSIHDWQLFPRIPGEEVFL